VATVHNFPRAQGKYVAFCEGDDFWTDPLKLQKQVYFMESNPLYSLCFHGVEVVDKDGRPTGRAVRPYACSQDVPIEDIILGIGEYHRTCSLLARADCMHNLPAFYFRAPAGDLALILSLAARGKVYYLEEVMASYRSGIAGSWTSQLALSAEKQVRLRTGLLQMFAEFDEFTGYRYRESVAQRRHRTQFLISLARGDIKTLGLPEYKRYRDEISRYLLVKVCLRNSFPNAYRTLRKLYDNIDDFRNNRG